jgi:ADP-heptose:LPS heptosyltransferase
MTLLVIRLSAMGDAAMSVPVIRAFTEQYPGRKVIFVTRKLFNPFFEDINNLTLVNPDLKGKHKGIAGLYRLFRELKEEHSPDVVIDIHDVLRSKIVRAFFRLSGIPAFVIDKGRKEKKMLTRKDGKVLKPLKHSTDRYAETFGKAGFPLRVDKKEKAERMPLSKDIEALLEGSSKKIGIAPFAMHVQKQYPVEKTKRLIHLLASKGHKVFIFGGGDKEKSAAHEMAGNTENIVPVIGMFPLADEIRFISNLDLMISMDSANMHIAALTGIHIVSIWGATHPYAGFTPYIADSRSHIIQRNDLNCRPCSVFGNKPCHKEHMECCDIMPEKIAGKCEEILKN